MVSGLQQEMITRVLAHAIATFNIAQMPRIGHILLAVMLAIRMLLLSVQQDNGLLEVIQQDQYYKRVQMVTHYTHLEKHGPL